MNEIEIMIGDVYILQGRIDDVQRQIDEQMKKIEEMKECKKRLEEQQESIKKEIVDAMKSSNSIDIKARTMNESVEAMLFSKKNVGYTDENKVLAMLLDNGMKEYVKTKYSIDKNALKKAIKSNNALHEMLKDYIVDSTTDYVVVTTEENAMKMKEHINEGKN